MRTLAAIIFALALALPQLAVAQSNYVPSAVATNPIPLHVKEQNFSGGCVSGCTVTGLTSTGAGHNLSITAVSLGVNVSITGLTLTAADQNGDTCVYAARSDSGSNGTNWTTPNSTATLTIGGFCHAISSGNTTATLTISGDTFDTLIDVIEWTAPVGTSPGFEQAAGTQNGTGSALTVTLAGATTYANDTILQEGYCNGGSGSPTFTNSFTVVAGTIGAQFAASSTGTYSTQMTCGGSPNSAAQILYGVEP